MSSSDTARFTVTKESPEPTASSAPFKFPFLSLLPKFNFPGKRAAEKTENTGHDDADNLGATEGAGNGSTTSSQTKKTDVVRFRLKEPSVGAEPLKLESEDSENNSNPLVLWQVYALGGFLILRWAWAKWQERKGNNSNKDDDGSDGDEPPPPQND